MMKQEVKDAAVEKKAYGEEYKVKRVMRDERRAESFDVEQNS